MSMNLALALVLVPAWVYLVSAAVAVTRFARRAPSLTVPCSRGRKGRSPDRLAVSVLKPLHGDEPGLYENLRSFAEQDYPVLQIVLGADDPQDGALPAARAMMRDLPTCDIALVVDARANGSNRKVANLENMVEAARHDVLVLADSDMRVDRHYLCVVTAPLYDRHTGVVTCLYKGVPTGGKWSELGAMHINFGFLPSALVAESLGLGGGCFGATIALRRETFERIGGFARLRDELADDHRIGDEVNALGLTVALSPYIVEARVSEHSLSDLWRHELRWARTVRAMAPAGFVGSVLAHPVAIAAFSAAATGFGLTASIFLVISCLLRWATARVIADALGLPPAKPWLLPVRDALSFAVFVASFFGRTVFWRDQVFRVGASGQMTADGDKAL
ncbi:MAG TPA: bacteriohopanetetrol glucosamine biosynthesis glycosyltransferase HpnI [Stellaceae bacterium]|nr:bacteriohopanetetrol glucosamine biosynthesis glycosyltransferase HpnI [Stellaceae bacterium]